MGSAAFSRLSAGTSSSAIFLGSLYVDLLIFKCSLQTEVAAVNLKFKRLSDKMLITNLKL